MGLKHNVKKLSMMLVLCILISLLPVIPVFAASDNQEHWAKADIEYIINKGYWSEQGDFLPDKPITRAEFSALLVKTLGARVLDFIPAFDDVTENTPYANEIYVAYRMGLVNGDGNNFRPFDSLSRQEAAAVLDRAYQIVDNAAVDAEIDEKRFLDFTEIDVWAQPFVFNALERGCMKGTSAKYFEPQRSITRAESAVIAVKLDGTKKLDMLDYSVRDAGKDEEKNFSVLQNGTTVSQRGVSGFAVVARFKQGPGEVYVSRQTVEETGQRTATPWDKTAMARVIDPDGNVVARYDFSHMKTGTEKKIITVNTKKDGIYTIQVLNGRDGDFFEIGINDCVSWGVRGEKILGKSTTMPKAGYVYTQRTLEYMYVGVSNTQAVSLVDLDGNSIAASTAVNRPYTKHDLYTTNAKPNTVYQLKFADNFSGGVITDGFPGLICPTVEMAEDLKGGWYDENDCVTQGQLQRRAREEAVRIAKEENLEVVINRPAEVPENLQNPKAEAQMFGAYGVISGVGAACARQELNPESPYLGRIYRESEYQENSTLAEHTFEACRFIEYEAVPSTGMVTAVSIPLELNYAYGNEALANRAALCLLHFLTAMGEDCEDRQNNLKDKYDPMVSMFEYDKYVEGYRAIKNFIAPSTREILYQGLFAVGDKMMDYPGQGVTNQGLFHPLNNLRLYEETGFLYLLDAFERQITSILDIDWPTYGYHQGHFIEQGMDSGYEYMNREEFFDIYLTYRKCEDKDEELFNRIENAVEEALYFESLFATPQPETGINYGANSWTGRTDPELGGGNQPSYETVSHIFPYAALRHNVKKDYDGSNEIYPQVINDDEKALEHIRMFYPAYENYYEPESGRMGREWPLETFEAFSNGFADYEGLELPCYGEDDIVFENDEVIVVKNKGIYLICVYATDHSAASSYAMLGGAPVIVWSEDTGVVGRSKKKRVLNSKGMLPGANEVFHASVFGTVDGAFFHSGREGVKSAGATEVNKLTWLEEGKKFSISGVVPSTGKEVVWIYELTDTGIDMTVQIPTLKDTDELWVNLPIQQADEKTIAELNPEEGKLTVRYNDSAMVYSWDKAQESLWMPASDETLKNGRLRVSVPKEGLTVHIELKK